MAIRPLFVFVLVLLGGAILSGVSVQSAFAQSLIERLKDGGYVVYFRHGATDRTQTDLDVDNLENCATQRQLSDAGREELITIGRTIASLDVPVGSVYSSPYCRCHESAGTIFGRYEIAEELAASTGVDAGRAASFRLWLRNMLSDNSAADTNVFLVGHTSNLFEATDIWPDPEGVAHVFRPLSDGNFEHLGLIMPDEWSRQIQGTDSLNQSTDEMTRYLAQTSAVFPQNSINSVPW